MRRNIMNLDTTTPQTFSAFFNRTGYRVDRDADDIERFEPTLLVTNVKDGNGRMITDTCGSTTARTSRHSAS